MTDSERGHEQEPETDGPSSPSSTTLATAGPPSPALSRTASTATKAGSLATSSQTKKRSASTSDPNGAPKITKRRAARACVSCRARKVRCDVVEGAPCGNCRWDNVECIVQESRRRKKTLYTAPATAGPLHGAEAVRASSISSNSIGITNGDLQRSADTSGPEWQGQASHLIYQRAASVAAAAGRGYSSNPAPLLSKAADTNGRFIWPAASLNQPTLLGDLRTAQFLNSLEDPDLVFQLPAFIKPLPSRIPTEDAQYLRTKGALTLPSPELQNALLHAYVEFVHPYMPLLELHDFLDTIHSKDGFAGQVSLFLYQAVMFVSTAFVGGRYLKEAGYASRKAARKDFFHRARLLYDFDYEQDRLVLVQGLLLMTYWYETPDDQKDTWHWMGVAISLAHTIGLHRNPANTTMPLRKQKLWKRIWWSCFMRDRLIALGMRRPTRIKDEDFDVPMLEEGDFEIGILSEDNRILPPECSVVRDTAMQHELAVMCVQKARLCVCINHMLKAQYSVLNREYMQPEDTTSSTMMLLPNKSLDNFEKVNLVDIELMAWYASLPEICQYRPLIPDDVKNGRSTIAVHRNLLHMVYHTTVSALHRPQFLSPSPQQSPSVSRQVQEMSRMRVRDAANQITHMVAELHRLHLERYLPTSGVTVILPAMIIHLLEMKSPIPEARLRATKGFKQCMRVMERLRETYAAADYATGFLDAALRKAAIDVEGRGQTTAEDRPPASAVGGLSSLDGAQALTLGGVPPVAPVDKPSTPPPDNAPYLNSTEVKLYHQDRTYMPRDANGQPAVVTGHTPPATETPSELAEGMTPSAIGSFAEEGDLMPVDFGMSQQDFDWSGVGGTNLDFDQWLQFPAEGMSTSDESLMGMFGQQSTTQESPKATELAVPA
ncbi:hypothetical protein VTK73DRAFT_8448 [Phialemonium thermophilum]|uniref:Zn(2)-C6 fungal-type domain-containing protein n=1 Tax=Phialemonium thermophilum TaxID=223376 RepID=A0ABR3W8J0_9PEZI